MAGTFTFELVSPERLLMSVEAAEVVAPGSDGYFTVMANHSPLMSTMRPGFVDVKSADGSASRFFVRGGFADVTPSAFTILAEQAIPAGEMTRDMLNAEIEVAKEAYAAAEGEDNKFAAHTFLQQLTELEGHGTFKA